MNISTAYLIAVLAALPSSALAQCKPGADLNPCEVALFDAAVMLRGQKAATEAELAGCAEKLRTRTSTVIRVFVPQAPRTTTEPANWAVTASASVLGFALGVLAGVAVLR